MYEDLDKKYPPFLLSMLECALRALRMQQGESMQDVLGFTVNGLTMEVYTANVMDSISAFLNGDYDEEVTP